MRIRRCRERHHDHFDLVLVIKVKHHWAYRLLRYLGAMDA